MARFWLRTCPLRGWHVPCFCSAWCRMTSKAFLSCRKGKGLMSKFIVWAGVVLVSCTCGEQREHFSLNGEREPESGDPDREPDEVSGGVREADSDADQERPTPPPHRATATIPPSGAMFIPTEKQSELDRLVADVTLEQGWTLSRPAILSNGELVNVRIEKGGKAIVLIMTPVEQARGGDVRSKSFAIRVGNSGVEDQDTVGRISTAVIAAIRRNDQGGLWERAP